MHPQTKIHIMGYLIFTVFSMLSGTKILYSGELADNNHIADMSLYSLSANAPEPLKIPEDAVYADSYGFNTGDATDALQKAIDSGAKTVVIKDMGEPWILRPIKLRSDLDLILLKGVVLEAKRGEYKSISDSMFKGKECSNLSIRGDSATIRMHKKDYQNDRKYKWSEWRHGISISGSNNVVISGMLILATGGDGIYVGGKDKDGYCKNVLIENVISADNHRQGLSVISAENITIRNCIFKTTNGTAPQCGIDLEPNNSNERLVNVIIDNCLLEGNKHCGISIFTPLDSTTETISIDIRNCLFKSNKIGVLLLYPNSEKVKKQVGGNISIANCRFIDNRNSDFAINNWSQDAPDVKIKNCIVDCSIIKETSVISYFAPSDMEKPFALINFDGCNIRTIDGKELVDVSISSPHALLTNTTGNINFNGKSLDLAKYFVNMGYDKPQALPTRKIAMSQFRLSKPEASGKPDTSLAKFRLRKKFDLMFPSGNNGSVTIDFVLKKIKARPHKMSFKLISPSENITDVPEILCDKNKSIIVKTPEKGIYRLSCSTYGTFVSVKKCSEPVCIATFDDNKINLHKPANRLYFTVPANQENLAVEIDGSPGESVDFAIYVKDNKVIEESDLEKVKLHRAKVLTSNVSEIGAIEFKYAVDDVYVKMPTPLCPILAGTPDSLIVCD